ncbi:WD40 repeat domain-containing serine/threonine-protein kinase [Pseudonocardia zijingensis]|uniref:non-specific serine/threonine protein kinase n=1 Tax=Pseudonocardia zijingensis TaxID=153376 RepID=A0ABP4AMR1_9PSEU
MTIADVRFGPYVLGPLLGRGGMGEVHRATDTSQDDRVVALKRLAPHLSADTGYRERFRRECEAAARLDDPHIVPIHRYGEIDGRLFLDMQLVDGRDLAAELAHTGPMFPARAVGIVAQVAAALDAAHAAGLVHRDVKPSNVLLTAPVPGRPDFAQLADFGIAAGPAAGGGADGTVEYLAPERLVGNPTDNRVDVYALACVLYELLTGLRAFPGSDFAAQVHGHLYLPPPRPTDTFGAIPPGLDAVVARGMAKDPAQRYQWAGALADDAIAALGPGLAGPAAPQRSTTSRRRLLLGAAGAVALAGGAALAVTLTRSGGQPAGPSPLVSGPPPEPVIEERALAVRSVSPFPFQATRVGGRPALLVDDLDNRTRLYDPVADRDLAWMPDNTVQISTADVVTIDGRDLVVTARASEIVLVDVQTSGIAPVGKHESMYGFAAAGSVLATAGITDGLVRRWDLRSRSLLGEQPVPVTGSGVSVSLSSVELDGRSCLVVQVTGPNLTYVWDMQTGEHVLEAKAIGSIAVLDGAPVLVSLGEQLVVVDLRTGAVVRRHDVGSRLLQEFALGVLNGRPVIATEGEDQDKIILLDVDTGQRFGAPMTGHEAELTHVDFVDLEGRPILVSAARDNAIRVWDVAVRAAS